MSWWKLIAERKITSDTLDVQFGRISCFAAAPVLLGCAIRAIGNLAASPAEMVIGILAALSTTLLLVILGLLLPLASSTSRSLTNP